MNFLMLFLPNMEILNFPTLSYFRFARSVNKNKKINNFSVIQKSVRQSILNFYSIKHVKLHMKNFTFTIFLLLFEIPQGNLVFLFFVISKTFCAQKAKLQTI